MISYIIANIIANIMTLMLGIVMVTHTKNRSFKPLSRSQGTQTDDDEGDPGLEIPTRATLGGNQFEWIPNCCDWGGDIRSSESPMYAYFSLKQVIEIMIKGEHKKIPVDSVTLDFKTTKRGKPRRSEEEAIKLMEEMDGETIVKAWFKESGRKRTRVTNKPTTKTPHRPWKDGAYKWHSIIEKIN